MLESQVEFSVSRTRHYLCYLLQISSHSLIIEKISLAKVFHDITKSTFCLQHLLPDPDMDSHNSKSLYSY